MVKYIVGSLTFSEILELVYFETLDQFFIFQNT